MPTLAGYYLLTHKLGEFPADCQDALALDIPGGVIALADGATESFYARPWAQALARAYVRRGAGGDFCASGWLNEAKERWRHHVHDVIADEKADIFVVNSFKAQKEACATFLTVRYSTAPDADRALKVEAEAIGDTCLLHFSGGRLQRAFPLETSAFPRCPEAISSNDSADQLKLASTTFTIMEGDRLVLATDAFARFLLRAWEQQSPAVQKFLALQEKEAVADFIARYRKASSLRMDNDDIGLVSLCCCSGVANLHDYSFSTSVKESSGTPRPADTIEFFERSKPAQEKTASHELSEAGEPTNMNDRTVCPRWVAIAAALFMVVSLILAVAMIGISRQVRTLSHEVQALKGQSRPIGASPRRALSGTNAVADLVAQDRGVVAIGKSSSSTNSPHAPSAGNPPK